MDATPGKDKYITQVTIHPIQNKTQILVIPVYLDNEGQYHVQLNIAGLVVETKDNKGAFKVMEKALNELHTKSRGKESWSIKYY